MLSVSLVVPVRNAARTLPHCLAALRCLDPPPAEVFLVDNGSTDGSLPLLREFVSHAGREAAQLLQEPRRGAAAARNAGIRAARGDVIAFTDADCAPEPGWLRHLIQPFQDPAIGAVAGRVAPAPATSTVELFSTLYTLRLPERPARHGRWTPWEGGYPTANLAVRGRLLEELRGFDEEIGIYGEDYDLCARLYACGLEIAYAPVACVYHHHRTTLMGMVRQAFRFGRSHPLLLRRHTECGLWVDLPRVSFVWCGCPLRAWLDLASADKKALAILLLGAMYTPSLALLLPYLLWLAWTAGRRAREAGTPVSAAAAIG
ncbi:MAG: glycosyltransferase, partial [Candidatus Methylomirabilales bacterium]